jgi:hypothetical protein
MWTFSHSSYTKCSEINVQDKPHYTLFRSVTVQIGDLQIIGTVANLKNITNFVAGIKVDSRLVGKCISRDN